MEKYLYTFQNSRYRVERIGFFEHGALYVINRNIGNIAAGTQHKRNISFGENLSDGPHLFPRQIAIENGEVEIPGLRRRAPFGYVGGEPMHTIAQRFDHIFEHERDHRLILYDKYSLHVFCCHRVSR